MAKADKQAPGKKASAPRQSGNDAANSEEPAAKEPGSRLWTVIKVLTAAVPLVGGGFTVVYTLLIQPCEKKLAECRETTKAFPQEIDNLKKQLAASQESLRKLPEAVAYLQGLETERAKIDRDIDLLSARLEDVVALAATSRQQCARAEPGADICKSAAKYEAAAREIPGRIDLKRKRSDSLTQQIETALAKLGGAS